MRKYFRTILTDLNYRKVQGVKQSKSTGHVEVGNAIKHLFLLFRHGNDHLSKSAPAPLSGAKGEIVLEIDLAVVLDLLAVFEDGLHHGLGVLTLGELDGHLLGHEVHDGVGNALGLLGGLLHEVRAVGAVDFDLIGLFHGKLLFLPNGRRIQPLSTCLILMTVL